MKPGSLLTFVLLVLMGISMAAAGTAEPVTPQAAPAVEASPATASFLCALNQTVSAPEPAAGLNPAPVLKTGATCGSCSLSPCVGAATGTACQVGTRRGRASPPWATSARAPSP